MNKPLSIRIAGWAFLVLGAVLVYVVWRSGLVSREARVVMGLAGLVISTVGFGLVWLAGTATWRARAAGAAKAASTAGEGMSFRHLAALAGPRLHVGQRAAALPRPAVDCSVCKRPIGILRCATHELWYCWECAAKHAATCNTGFHHIAAFFEQEAKKL